jgi:hypothetical protein
MTDHWAYQVTNRSPFDAADIEVEVHRSDGYMHRTTTERLAGGPDATGYHSMECDRWPMAAGDDPFKVLSEVFIRFSDARRLARYEVHDRLNRMGGSAATEGELGVARRIS